MYNKEDDGSVLCKNCGLRQLIPLTIVNSDGSCPCMQCGHKLFHKPLPVADGEGEKVGRNKGISGVTLPDPRASDNVEYVQPEASEKLEHPSDLIKSLNWCKNLFSSITAASIAGKNLDFVKHGTPFFEEMLNAYQSAKSVLMNYENETHYATQFGEYQLCPKCGGNKTIPNPFKYQVTGPLEIPCDICNGAGIIPKPILPSAVTGMKWVELKEGNPLPDYDEPVLWLHEDGNMHVDALDKDGNPWIFGEEFQGFTYPKATHWMPLPHPPSEGQPAQGKE